MNQRNLIKIMGWQDIGEGIISSLIAAIISAGFTILIGKIKGGKIIMLDSYKGKFKITKLNPFSIALFITSFFTILSAFSFYYQWKNMPYLITITIFLWIGAKWVYETRCPECKKIFTRIKHLPDIFKEEKRDFVYTPEKVILFSDGTVKERIPEKKKQTFTKRIRTQQDNFSCKSCNHKWQSDVYERDLDPQNKPQHKTEITNIRNPIYKEWDL